MKIENIEISYNYYSATLYGLRGSNKSPVVIACGCWDTQAEAIAALDTKCDKAAKEWAAARGDGADPRDWLSDFSSSRIVLEVVPSRSDKPAGCGLLHGLIREVDEGDEPSWTEEELRKNIGDAAD